DRSPQNDLAVVYFNLDIGRIDIGILSKALVNILFNALVGPAIAFRSATGIAAGLANIADTATESARTGAGVTSPHTASPATFAPIASLAAAELAFSALFTASVFSRSAVSTLASTGIAAWIAALGAKTALPTLGTAVIASVVTFLRAAVLAALRAALFAALV